MNPAYNSVLQSWKHSRTDTLSELPTSVAELKKLSYTQYLELRQKHPELYQMLIRAAKDENRGRW